MLPKDPPIEELFKQFERYQEQRHSAGYKKRCGSVLKNVRAFLVEKHPALKWSSQVSPHLMQEYFEWRRDSKDDEGKEAGEDKEPAVTKRTLNIELLTLKTIFNLGVEWGLLNVNPVAEVKPLKTDDSKPMRSLTVQEVQALLKISPEWFRPILEIALYTGMREGEIIHLEWSDVDLKKKTIRIQRKEGWVPKSTGGSIRERVIYINDEAANVLRALKLKYPKPPANRVFLNSVGHPLTPGLRKVFMRLTDLCGFPEVSQFHALRHTFGTHAVAASKDLVAVKDLMGHRDIKTTMRYLDPIEDQKRKVAEAISYASLEKTCPSSSEQAAQSR